MSESNKITREALRKDWAVRSPRDIRERCRELSADRYLVEGLLPTRSLGILVGDSGLGKTPLCYQLGLCVAAGIPFLGRQVQQGTTLYLDFENGLATSAELTSSISKFLGLKEPPEDFLVWNVNDCSPWYGQASHTAMDMVRAIRPALTIIDSLGSYQPETEGKNSSANRMYQDLRAAMRDCSNTTLGVHHPKKPSARAEEAPPSLETGDLRRWFRQTRGASALVNGSDVRLGVEMPNISGPSATLEKSEEIGLVLRGFARVRGEIGPVYLARALDDQGEPLGYRPMIGVELLFNKDQQETFGRLPESFMFKDAKQVYGRGDQATRDFLMKCRNAGLLHQPAKGRYEKVKEAE